MADGPEPLVRVEGLNKSFGAVHALNDVSLDLHPGEVVGLIGANGAGKSTLMKVLAGEVRPDSGRILLDGAEVRFRSPRDALGAGIAMCPQEMYLVEEQSVADNLFIGDLPGRGGVVRGRELRRNAAEILAEVGLEVDPLQQAGTLTAVEARLVSVGEALSKHPRLLILDEPSAALPTEVATRLGPLVRRLAERGSAVVYVSHRLHEIREFCDRVIAMRDGKITGRLRHEEATEERMIKLVGGKALTEEPPPQEEAVDLDRGVVMRARGLCGQKVTDVDLDVYAGEIVGIGGLYGSGRSELLRLLAGVQGTTAGQVEVFGKPGPRTPNQGAKAGVGYLPEGRGQMLFPQMSVAANATISVLRRHGRVLVHYGRERKLLKGIAEDVRLVGDPDAPIQTLSGGNQQKVGLARWLLREAGVLVLDEPTVGIDVHARAEIHQLLRRLAKEKQTTVVMASAEPEELALLCDRVLVMVEGRVNRELKAPFEADAVVAASYVATPTVA